MPFKWYVDDPMRYISHVYAYINIQCIYTVCQNIKIHKKTQKHRTKRQKMNKSEQKTTKMCKKRVKSEKWAKNELFLRAFFCC